MDDKIKNQRRSFKIYLKKDVKYIYDKVTHKCIGRRVTVAKEEKIQFICTLSDKKMLLNEFKGEKEI
jgi:hypothetical protein